MKAVALRMKKMFTTDFTDFTDGIQRRMLSSADFAVARYEAAFGIRVWNGDKIVRSRAMRTSLTVRR
jgi:hypothetical protein